MSPRSARSTDQLPVAGVPILAIEAASAQGSIAVAGARGQIVQRACAPGQRAVETLVPTMMACLQEAEIAPRDVELIVVDLGPGGFTGIRAGVAVARAFCLATGRPALGLTALAIAADRALAAGHPAPICVVRDAQRGELVVQSFDGDGNAREEPRLLEGAVVERQLGSDWRTLVRLGEVGRPLSVEAVHIEVSSAVDLLVAAKRRLDLGAVPVPGSRLRPFYLRPPDATPAAGDALVRAG